MKKQQAQATSYRLSKNLKAVVIVLGILGAMITVGIVCYRLLAPDVYVPDQKLAKTLMGFSVFTVITAGLCYKILWHFWHVCTEIGRDNSFSPENESSFHKMANTAFFIAGLYIVRLAIYGGRSVFYGNEIYSTIILCGVMVVLLVLFVLFGVICEALSRLINNAYEIKAENDLTI